MKVRIGTRNSKLALVQANLVAEWLKESHEGMEVELCGITTQGDIILDQKLDKIGGKGLFIKELEQALLRNDIDIAVHSAKDLPAKIAEGLSLVAVSAREDARDALVSLRPGGLNSLPVGAIVGTSSARRESQLRMLRPDLSIRMLRGNVLTRLEKLKARQFDAIILASAGLRRLDLEKEISSWFSVTEMVPAVGQGILAIEARSDFSRELFEGFHDAEAWDCLVAERATMIALEGDCSIPLGVHASIEGPSMRVTGFYFNGQQVRTAGVEGRPNKAECLGRCLAEKLLQKECKECQE